MPFPTRALVPLALAAGFALAHTQSPLFYSNQNQYLLHGLAAGGYGHLDRDWLATTRDPTPVFSAGVALAYRVAGLWPIQAGYFLLLMGYFLAAWRLAAAVVGTEYGVRSTEDSVPGTGGRSFGTRYSVLGTRYSLVFAALFTAAHAAVFRVASVWAAGADYPWYLQAGVAGQYALGPGLQPSAFGVLLVASLAAFAAGRAHLAAALAAGAAVLHATYLLPAALLTLGYMAALAKDGRRRAALGVGAVSLAVALPAVAYTFHTFPPAGGDFAESQRILAEVRIPHHSQVARWLDGVALLQLAWVAAGLVVVRKTRLFLPLLVPAVGAVALTLAQVATGDHTLALLFPWRVSVVLVPVTTAVFAATLAARLPASRPAAWAAGVLVVAQAAGGVAVMALGLGYRMNEAERPVLDYVRAHAGPGDVYLIPARVPPVGTGPRGVPSTSFTPPPRPKPGSNLIPVDLQRFRLATGVPIYADFKSVPYGAAEVGEWLRRVRQVEAWYAEKDWDAAGVRAELANAGITHVLVPRGQSVTATFLAPVYADEAYSVYRVR